MSQATRGQEILEGLGEGQKQLWKKNGDVGGKERYQVTDKSDVLKHLVIQTDWN